MRPIKTYLAVNEETRKGYICEAYAKKQMKAAGMNMKLNWYEEENFEKAKRQVLYYYCFELANCSNVTRFKY